MKFDKHLLIIWKKANAKVTDENCPYGEEKTIDEFFYSVSIFLLPSVMDVLLQEIE